MACILRTVVLVAKYCFQWRCPMGRQYCVCLTCRMHPARLNLAVFSMLVVGLISCHCEVIVGQSTEIISDAPINFCVCTLFWMCRLIERLPRPRSCKHLFL